MILVVIGFNLQKEKPDGENLHVKHFHFISWPDEGVPGTYSTLISFLKHTQKNRKLREENPMVVHCSAGVGRTGTFIAISILLQKINVEDSINIFECVNQLRKKRLFMVQALVRGEEQYVLL